MPILSESQKLRLASGEVVIEGRGGQYQVMALAEVSAAIAWSVLTDYDNFHQFLPSVANSRVIETNGTRKLLEQIDRRRIMLKTIESRILTENVEINREQISFRLLEGNLKYMYGHWRLDPAAWQQQRGESTLVSQQVNAEIDLGRPVKKMFYRMFEASLVDTIQALRDEMERRA